MSTNKNVNFIRILTKYTDINQNFIKDFFGNFNPVEFNEKTENEFTIEDRKAAKWLGITLSTLRKRLNGFYRSNKKKNKYYMEYVDFIKKRFKKNVNYYLTYKCFESLSMQSQTIKGEIVRGYFIKLREFIQTNQNLIYQNLTNNDILKKINRDSFNQGKEFIYIFVIDPRYKNIFKIGRTIDIIKRLNTYNVGRINEISLKFLAVVHDSKLVEKCMKSLLQKYQFIENKEIYKVTLSFLEKILAKCTCDDTGLCELINYLKLNKELKPYIIFQ